MLDDLFPSSLGWDHLPCCVLQKVYNKIIGKANVSLYCAEVNSFCNAMRFTQDLVLSGLRSPKEVKGCEQDGWRAVEHLGPYLHSEKWCSTAHTTVWCFHVWEAEHIFFSGAPLRRINDFAMGWAQVWGTDPSHVFTPLWQAGISLRLSLQFCS